MANFDIAIQKVLANEGKYSNDPDDNGGETYKGVSRKNNKDWSGWIIIDNAKKLPNFPECLNSNSELQSMIHVFYNLNYWRLIKGDEITSQRVAETIFDFAVNAGVSTAIKLIQRGAMLKDDGIIGKQTLDFINSEDEAKFIAGYCILKIQRYIDICEKNPTQKKYFYGWVKRAMI